MKRITIIAIITALFSMSVISCKDDDSAPTPVTTKGAFFNAFADSSSYETSVGGPGNYSYGMLFSVTKAGKITQLGARMPESGTYKLTLWDTTGRVILKQVNVTVTGGTAGYIDIDPVTATVGKVYLLSIQSDNTYYVVEPKLAANIAYPITSGDIKFVGYQWKGSITSEFPTNVALDYIAGLADLTFVAN